SIGRLNLGCLRPSAVALYRPDTSLGREGSRDNSLGEPGMAADRLIATLVDALKQALAESGAQRLFRSGKLNGLFPRRGAVNSEAAARALRDGLLEVVRTETRGKTVIEWVRLTPRGVNFLHEHESPLRALEELRGVLQAAESAVPVWLAEMKQ